LGHHGGEEIVIAIDWWEKKETLFPLRIEIVAIGELKLFLQLIGGRKMKHYYNIMIYHM
jgi:hypothetical protein